MPVVIFGHKFKHHYLAVNWLKIHKPGINDPNAYVAFVERKQRPTHNKNKLHNKTFNIKMARIF